MPLILLDRLPLPKLKTYVIGSLIALSGCIYFSIQVIINDNDGGNVKTNDDNVGGDVNVNNRIDATGDLNDVVNGNKPSTVDDTLAFNLSANYVVLNLWQWIYQIFFVMIREPVCVWTMINMAFCCLILIGRCIQKLVFGELRVSEQQHLKDKFWNFVFYKFIFIFGVINVQYIDEVLLWCSWFASLGFLHLLSLLGKDRFEYLSFSPTTPIWNHVKLLCLLTCISALSGFMLLVSVFVGFFGGFNTFAFMSAEVILLAIRTLHVILRYILHLYEMRREFLTNNNQNVTTTTTELKNKRSQVNVQRHDTNVARTETNNLGQDTNTFRQDTNSLRSESNSLRSESNSLRSESNSLRSDSNSLRSDSNSLRSDANNLRQETNTLRSHANTVRHDTNALRNQTNVLFDDKKRNLIIYYVELIFDLSSLLIDFVHHIHMLLWSNIFLSMASLVICMQLRYLLNEIQRRYKKHKNYVLIHKHLEENYPMASSEELEKNSDNCAICWDKMDVARKLPCQHLFHNQCLQSWLEQDTSCPTCRLTLNIKNTNNLLIGRHGNHHHHHHQANAILQVDNVQNGHHHHRQLNHFFHFDGSRYVSWLPSFSVEVSHAHLLRSPEHVQASNSQLDAMGRQVQQLFPHIPIGVIIDDLRVTRSVEMTIENILDSRLTVLPQTLFRNSDDIDTTTRHRNNATTTSSSSSVDTITTASPSSPIPSSSNTNTSNIDTTSSSSSTITSSFIPANLLQFDTSSIVSRDADYYTDTTTENVTECESSLTTTGSRFSKSSTERERILQRRKEQLIQAARKRYIERQKTTLSLATATTTTSTTTTLNTLPTATTTTATTTTLLNNS